MARRLLVRPAKEGAKYEKKYDPAFCDMLKNHFEQGFSFRSFAAVAGVSFETLFHWVFKHQDFAAAKKAYEPLGLMWLEQAASKAMFLPDGVKFSQGVWCHLMDRRFGETNPKNIDQDKLVNFNRLSPEELSSVITAAEEALEQLRALGAERENLITIGNQPEPTPNEE